MGVSYAALHDYVGSVLGDLPAPIPGVLGVRLELGGGKVQQQQQQQPSPLHRAQQRGRRCDSAGKSESPGGASAVAYALPPAGCALPRPLFPLREILFRGLGTNAGVHGQRPVPSAWTPLKLLQLLRFAVMDYPLLLHCPSTRPLAVLGEALLVLLYPFKWNFPYV